MLLQIISPVAVLANSDAPYAAPSNAGDGEIPAESVSQNEVVFDISDIVEESIQEEVFNIPQGNSVESTDGGLDIGGIIASQPVRAGQTIDMPITVDVKATGLNSQAFGWTDLAPQGLNFRIDIDGQSVSSDTSGQDLKVSQEGQATFTINAEKPQGKSKLIVYAAQNIGIRLFQMDSTGEGEGGGLNFTLRLYELPNPNIDVKYVDIYGKKLTENLPSANTVKVTTNIKYEDADENLVDKEFLLPTSDQTVNVRELDNTDVDKVEFNKLKSLDIKLAGKTSGDLTVDGKKYSYTVVTDANMKNPTQITLKYDADVAIPPMKDDGKTPVDAPDGYTRITFDPTDAAKKSNKKLLRCKKHTNMGTSESSNTSRSRTKTRSNTKSNSKW